MSERRKLHFDTEIDALSDLVHLRAGHTRLGEWSLAQVCWHCSSGLRGTLQPPASTEPTPEQAKGQEFIHEVADNGWPDRKFPAVDAMLPPASVGDEAIDELAALLRQMAMYRHTHVDHKHFFGPVPIGPYRRFILEHLAHHLSYLLPTKPPRRKDLHFADDDAVIAEIERLRPGYGQAGLWSLAQICWHLDATTAARMNPGPAKPNSPEHDAMAPIFQTVLQTGKLPPGIKAPDAFVPPAEVGDEAIDHCIATLKKWTTYEGPVAQHRIFGNLTLEQARILNRTHCANHLSCLLPLGK